MNQASIDQDQILTNLSNQHSWIRLIYMLIYGVMLHVAGLILWLLCGAQFICTLIFGADNQSLRNLTASIIGFVNDALRFVSYNSESRPFPFTGEHQPQGAPEPERAAPADDVTGDAQTGGETPAAAKVTPAIEPEGQSVDNPDKDAPRGEEPRPNA